MAGSAEANGRLWGVRARDWAEILESRMRPLFEAVLERVGVGPGARHLDLACGSGLASAIAAERGAQVSGIDAAEPMLAIARERTPAGRFEVADLEALPFPDTAFDTVTSFNGVQFAADPHAALREARRVLKPSGKVGVAVWAPPDRVEAASVIRALAPLLPPPPPGAPGPFALSEPETLAALLRESGLQPVETFEVAFACDYPDLETAVRGFDGTGVAERARGLIGDAAVSDAHRRALERFVRPGGGVRVGVAFTGIVATRG